MTNISYTTVYSLIQPLKAQFILQAIIKNFFYRIVILITAAVIPITMVEQFTSVAVVPLFKTESVVTNRKLALKIVIIRIHT